MATGWFHMLNGPAVTCSSTRITCITCPLYARSVTGVLGWCLNFWVSLSIWILCPKVFRCLCIPFSLVHSYPSKWPSFGEGLRNCCLSYFPVVVVSSLQGIWSFLWSGASWWESWLGFGDQTMDHGFSLEHFPLASWSSIFDFFCSSKLTQLPKLSSHTSRCELGSLGSGF